MHLQLLSLFSKWWLSTRDYICLQMSECNSCYLHTHKWKTTPKATPCLSFLLASFKWQYYKVGWILWVKGAAFWDREGDRKEIIPEHYACKYFENLCLFPWNEAKWVTPGLPGYLARIGRSRVLCEPASSSLSNNSVNGSGFSVFLHITAINQFLITVSKRPDPKWRFRAELLKIL